MATTYRHWWSIAAFAATASGAAMLPAVGGWLHLQHPPEFAGLLAIAIVTAAIRRLHAVDEGVVMPASFIVDFAALLLLGANAAMLVAAAGTLAEWFAYPHRAHRLRKLVVNGANSIVGIQLAGLAYQALGGMPGAGFEFPWHMLPIGAAIALYCLVTIAVDSLVAPLLTRQRFNRAWLTHARRSCPLYVVGGGLATALVAVVEHRAWMVLAAAALPLYFCYLAYADYVRRLEEEHHSREVVESMDEGMAVIDASGKIKVWSHALEHILGCPRDRVLGLSINAAVPLLATTELPRTIDEAVAAHEARTITFGISMGARVRTLQVKVLPAAADVTLLWYDVTERTRSERELRRREERLALAAEGANDGLWEWDLRTDEIYFSARWRGMIGIGGAAGPGRPETWMERVHPDDVASFKEAVRMHLAGESTHLQHEHRIRHEDGTYRWFLCRGIVAHGAGRRPIRIAGSLTETTEGGPSEGRRRSTGAVDPLTGLANRAVFVELVGKRLIEYKEQIGGDRFAVLFLDMDRFKVVNDSLGHLVGDELIVAVSRRLESCLRPNDTLARLGGDEFAILLNGLIDEQQANAVAFRIQKTLATPILIGGREVFTSVSIGIAPGMRTYANAEDIMRDADTAMYHAKRRGKARHEMFDADMHAKVQDRLSLENDLRHAIDNQDFEVHYQPIVRLSSRMCIGFESLIRWTRNGEAVSPATFIPIAEELGLIEPLGTWVLQHACRTFAVWKNRFPGATLDFITINASSRQLMQQNFVSLVSQAVHDSGLQPSEVRIEITETALMDSPSQAAAVLTQLRDFGVKIYLDDFGTGYSSLSHLHKLPVDALKIDRSFVKSLLLPDRPPVVESILALARTLNTSVVAEGIETDSQASELARLGCTHAQGYFFSRPLTSRAVELLLTKNEPLGPKPIAPATDDPEIYYVAARPA